MSGAFVQTKASNANSVASISVTLGSNVASGNHVSCVVTATASINLSSSSGGGAGATWHNAVADFLANSVHMRADYTENTASGSWTVTGNNSGTTSMGIAANESSGVATSLSLGATNHNNGTTSTQTTGSITPAAGSVLYAGVTDNASAGTAADTIDSSFTVDQTGGTGTNWDEVNVICGSAHLNNASGSAVNPTWTTTHTGLVGQNALIMEFVQAAAGRIPIQMMTVADQSMVGSAI